MWLEEPSLPPTAHQKKARSLPRALWAHEQFVSLWNWMSRKLRGVNEECQEGSEHEEGMEQHREETWGTNLQFHGSAATGEREKSCILRAQQ